MQKTTIEYLTHTWNPLAMRCTPVSAGCANCWHIRMCNRLAKNPKTEEWLRAIYAGGGAAEPKDARAPLRYKNPSVIGVQFMGDIAHWSVRLMDFLCIMDTMHKAPWHTYLLLTKRSQQLAELVSQWRNEAQGTLGSHIWLGVSVEDQVAADERIPPLLQIPAAHHWLSYEPALGPIDITGALYGYPEHTGGVYRVTREMALDAGDLRLEGEPYGEEQWEQAVPPLQFVVAGAETGPGARPAELDWFRDVRDQCKTAGVPFFMKAVSGKGPIPDDLMVRELPWGSKDKLS
jgi:protein gp37